MVGNRTKVRLEEVCSWINRGSAPFYTNSDGILVLNQKCVRDYRIDFSNARRTDNVSKPVKEERILRLLDIVVNSTGVGTLGRVAQITRLPELTTVDSHVTIVRPDAEKTDPQFLGFVLKHRQPEIEALAEGSTGQTELSRARLAALEIPFPPRAEQSAIGCLLGTLDDKIDLLRDMNRTLEDVARAVFRAWFVTLEPVRAKASGATSFRGMPQKLFDALPDALERSDTRNIPAGWEVDLLENLVAMPITRGLAPKYADSGGVAVLNQKCVRDWDVNFDLARRHNHDAKPTKEKVIERFDILVNSTGVGTLGRVAQVQSIRETTTFDSHLSLVRPDKSKIAALYLGYDLTEREDEIERLGHGSTGQTELSRQKLGELKVLVPQMDAQITFGELISPMVERRDQNRREIETLSDLRDALLPKLISGELAAPSLKALGLKVVGDGG